MKLKSQKGSITIFVLVALLFYTAFLLLMYAANTNKFKTITEKGEIVKGIYAKNANNDSINELYKKMTFVESEDGVVYKADRLVFDGTNYINTGIKLLSEENVNKNFEISFDFIGCNYKSNPEHLLSICDESAENSPYFRIMLHDYANKKFKVTDKKDPNPGTSKRLYLNENDKVRVRKYGNTIVFYQNDSVYITYELDEGEYSNAPLTFGAALNADGNPYQFYHGEFANIEVKFIEEEYKEIKTANSYKLIGNIGFNGAKYIDTGLSLFSQENKDKDFEISFDIIAASRDSDKIVMYNMDNSQDYLPGISMTSRNNGDTNYLIEGNTSSTVKGNKKYPVNTTKKIKLIREYNLLYLIVNNEEKVRIVNYKNINNFDSHLIFGAMINSEGTYDKYFKGVLANIEVKLEDQKFNYTEAKTKKSYRLDGAIKFDGTNYIDTGLKLFSEENINKDFEINFDVISLEDSIGNNATILNSKLEISPYPGFVLRYNGNNLTNLIFRTTYNGNSDKAINKDLLETVKIARKNKKIYYTVNNETEYEMKDFTDFTSAFSVPLTFGCSLDSSGNPFRYFKGILRNINVQIAE